MVLSTKFKNSVEISSEIRIYYLGKGVNSIKQKDLISNA